MQSVARTVAKDLQNGMRLISVRNSSAPASYGGGAYGTMYGLNNKERAAALKCDMDSLPKPYGNWQEIHGARQRKFNMHLVLSIIACVLSGVLVYKQEPLATPNIYAPINIEAVFQERKARME